MVVPKIDEKLYSSEVREDMQRELDKSYVGVEPLKTGAYPAILGIESIFLAKGFAFAGAMTLNRGIKAALEFFAEKFGALGGNNTCIYKEAALNQPCNARNFYLVQPIPDRTMQLKLDHPEKDSASCFALYIRYKMPEEKKKLPIIKPSS